MVSVSLVVPTFRRAHVLGRALTSVQDQTFPDFEVIVVDGGSRDGTRDIVRSLGDSRFRLIEQESNEGAAAAKNEGLDRARGRWIGIFDSDDELLPDALESLIATAEKLDDADVGTIIGNCVGSGDGRLTGKGIDVDGFVPYEDFLCGRVGGEFWGLTSSEILGDRRFSLTRGFESILWYDIYRRSKTYYVHRPVRRYNRGASDSLSDSGNLVTHASAVADGYAVLLDTHGSEMLRACPRRYAHFMNRRAIFELLAGRRSRGRSTAMAGLRSAGGMESLLTLGLATVAPRALVAALIRARARL